MILITRMFHVKRILFHTLLYRGSGRLYIDAARLSRQLNIARLYRL
jgi:hypothetical protein